MEYVHRGSSGLKVSRMALGMGLREQLDADQAERLVRRAFDQGINLFDCANIYGPGDNRANTAQNPYSLLEREMFPFARAAGVGIMAYGPLAIGLLSGMYGPDTPPSDATLWAQHLPDRLRTVLGGQPGRVIAAASEIATRMRVTMAQVALLW